MYPALDKRLLNYVRGLREANLPVSVRKLIKKGREVAQELNCTKIRFSNGWLYKFLKRNGLCRRKKTSNSQHHLEDLSPSIENFKRKFAVEVIESDTYDLVINMDELSITRDSPSDTTIDFRGVKSVQIKSTGCEKTSYTVVLAVSFTGEKLPAMLIWPSKGKKHVNVPVPDNLYLEYREKSWMDQHLMKKWISHILTKRKRKIKEGKKGLIMFDGFKAHLQKDVIELIEENNFDVWTLPPNTTPYLQPLDISTNRSFKNCYKVEWDDWFEKNKNENIKPSKSRIIEWTSCSWTEVSREVVLNGWKAYIETHAEIKPESRKFLFLTARTHFYILSLRKFRRRNRGRV